MPLPRNLFASSFRRQRMSALFTAVVGFMVFAATITVAAEATLSAMTIIWDKDVEARLTVEIPAIDDESSVPQAERVKQVLAVLRAMPEVRDAREVPEADTAHLLQSWITDAEVLKSLPLPALIDVTRKPDIALSGGDLHGRLKSVVPDVRIDDHAAWMQDIARLVRGLAAMGGMMILLAALTLGIAVSFFCRAVMAVERDTVALLHLMGAEDRDIASHFEGLARKAAAPPALIGFLAAVAVAALLAIGLRHFPILAPLTLKGAVLLGGGILLVPCMAIVIAAMTVRFSVIGLLRAMP